MAGGLVPVAIHGKDLIRGQLGNSRQPVRQGLIGQDPQGVIHVCHHRTPALTMERGKIIGLAGTVTQSRPVFLEKGAAAGGGFQHAQETALKIIVIGKIRARSGVRTPAGQTGDGLKKGGVHGGVCLSNIH